jgi:serine/threonine-protein kinase
MGRVYLASRQSPQTDIVAEKVALKILDPGLAKRKMIRDFFIQEAELGKGLSHPNLVAFVENGEIGGYLYLACEYIQGLSLDKLLKKKGPFEVDLALSVLQDVAFGLASAHQKGIVHRDLKPQNVMITPDNVIKVIDFGLADADQGVGEGRTVGTPVYAAPEQNLAKKTGPEADIYSLGLMTRVAASRRSSTSR